MLSHLKHKLLYANFTSIKRKEDGTTWREAMSKAKGQEPTQGGEVGPGRRVESGEGCLTAPPSSLLPPALGSL